MISRTHNSSNSSKAQFFVLSAFIIVSILYLVSRWMEPYTIIDTSTIVLMDEPFIFNNIVEKAKETVETSKDCTDLTYNIEEYSNFVSEFSSGKNMKIDFSYDIQSCTAGSATVDFILELRSTRMYANSSFSASRSFV